MSTVATMTSRFDPDIIIDEVTSALFNASAEGMYLRSVQTIEGEKGQLVAEGHSDDVTLATYELSIVVGRRLS